MSSPTLRNPTLRSFALALSLLFGLGFIAPSQALPTTTTLADKPIAAGADVPGNLALALSVEFPTAISIANLGDYADSTQYLGYFDPLKCYDYFYNTITPTNSFFTPNGVAHGSNNHSCSNQWSGNFMNWASMQTIDPFRWALTGGYRSVDTLTHTILEKAWGSQQGSAGSNFPYRGTSQGGGNNLNSGLINSVTPLGAWNSFDLGVWGNGNAMVISGDGGSYTTQANSALDFSNLSTINTTAGAALGAYRLYIRVKVCDPAQGLEPNCVQYGTHYKPEGLIQQYSQKIRFSAFGYLNEGGDVRQGGAMRAPMGFVGPILPQALSPPVANPSPEWDPTTGIMSTNPDPVIAAGSGVSQSGVMNYLNKFGEYGQQYKTYDNVGELYYAAVRYFENMGNVPEWTNGASATALDGFPAVPIWPTDTTGNNPRASILYTCQKNFILGIGDDHTWFDYNVGGDTDDLGGRPMPAAVQADAFNSAFPNNFYNQASAWTKALQGAEGITQTPVWPFDSGATYFIAGLAYGVHVNDIRPDMTGAQTISTYWMDVAEGQHLENMNPYYLAAKYGGFAAGTIPQGPAGALDPLHPPLGVNPPGYDMSLTPALGQFDTTGANVNMNGNIHPLPDNYYNAGNANAMVAGLKSAFVSISSSISQQSTSFSFSLPNVSTGSQSFGASYDSNGWVGTVTGYTLSFDIDGNPTQTPLWCTSACGAPTSNTLQTQLAGTNWQTNRRVATYDGSVGLPFEMSNISSSPNFSAAQVAALRPSYALSGSANTDETNFVNYLRGDQSNEISSTAPGSTHAYRNRSLLLGDIVDAGLTPVSSPVQTFSDANNPGYTAFKALWTPALITDPPKRPTMVYAGANDGMLHAFEGLTGVERFAYVPSALLLGPNNTPQVDGLAQLGNPTYVHHNYVDATPATFDIDMNHTYGASGAPDWHTVLIGGLGKGGRSFYALDITDPASITSESIAASKVLWEFPNKNAVANTDPAGHLGYSYGTPVVVKTVKYGWVIIVTSGYDNSDSPTSYGYLYFINPKTGDFLEKVRTPSAAPGMTQASAFVKDFSDETADSVYVGDLNGQLWRFDLRGTPAAYPPPVLLATATDGGGVAQPISTAPLIEIHPVTRERYVLFGTGVLLSVVDLPSTQTQSFYAIKDGTAATFLAAPAIPIARTDLTPISDVQISSGTANAVGAIGWYTDLGNSATAPFVGWRVILNPQAFNGIVTFATSLTTATDPCSPQGSSRVYAIDYATVDSVLVPNVVGGPIPAYDEYVVAAINLRFTGANGNPEIVVGFTKGDPEKVNANLTSTLATKILNWREIPTVE
jgi:type IV pilus assembly protein PilY1